MTRPTRTSGALAVPLVLAMASALVASDNPYGDRQQQLPPKVVDYLSSGQVISSPAVFGFSWEARAAFSDPRTSSGIEGGAASLIAGTLYVSHGFRFGDGVLLSSYDPATNTWTHGGAGLPDAATPRSEMSGAMVGGVHYAIGGRNGPNGALEAFTPGGGWATLTAMPTARGGAGAAASGGLIYVVGGRDGGSFGAGTILGTNEVYDPGTDSWATLTAMPTPVSDNYATVAFGGRIYVFGGATSPSTVTGAVQIYDIATDSWSTGTPMPTPRGAAMAGIINDQIAVFGGFTGSGPNLTVTEIYHPDTDSWTPGPDMPLAASEIAAGMTYDGQNVYSVGTGIFGASGMSVQVLRGPARTSIPTLQPVGIGILAVLVAGGAFLLLRRRG